MTELFNRSSEKARRRRLRSSMPKAEVLLWSRLKGKRMCGVKFRRQYSVGRYVIDFYSPELRLAIELDGESHFLAKVPMRDADRQAYVEQFGVRFLRFTNQEVFDNLEGVIETIYGVVNELRGRDPV